MDKKIGLEHTIRNVMNKPADSSESKVGLEHAIRNVMTESIGGPNTDKFKGTPPSFLRPVPIIKPKVGDAHPDGTAAITQRGKDKIKSSETMKEEEQLDERAPRPPKGYVAPKPKTPAGIGPGNKAAPESSPWEKLTDIKRNDGIAAEIGKDLLPIVGTWRQAKRTGEAYDKTVDAFSKGNYWDATKGVFNTAGQGVLTGVSAAGDALTATGIGAAPVAAARVAVKGAPKAISSLASTIKSVVAGSKTEKAAEIVAKAPATTTAVTKTVPAVNASASPKVDASIMGNMDKLKVKGSNISQKDVNIGAADNANMPPKIKKPDVVEPTPTTQKSSKDNKTANDQETFDYKQQSNLKLKPKRDQVDIPPTPDKNAALEKIFKKQPKLDEPANVNAQPIKPKDIGKDKPKFDEPANVNVKKPDNDNLTVKKAAEAPAPAKQAEAPAPAKQAEAPAPAKQAEAPAPAKQAEAPAKAEAPKKAEAPAAKPQTRKPSRVRNSKGVMLPPFGLPSLGGLGDASGGGGSAAARDVGTYLHRAGARRGDRFNEEIDPVAAETIKTKTRKAQIIRKVIDEQKKKKETSTVILNPKLKHQEADQN